MNRQWKTILVKASFWLVTEIILNLLGLDNLADYSEFLFEKEVALSTYQSQVVVVASPEPPQFIYNLPYRSIFGLNA